MDDEAKKLIRDQYAKLPSVLQEAVQSAHLHEQITAIGTKHHLHIDQIGLLEDEVMFLMMGFTEPIEFPGHLQENVHIEAELAQKIAVDINENIILPIRDRVENNTTETEAPKEIKNPPAMSPAPAMPEKSVVMPSTLSSKPTPASAPISTPVGSAPVVPSTSTTPVSTDMQINAPLDTPKPQVAASTPEEDVMFNEPTVSLPNNTPAAPQSSTPPVPPPTYKADPYREPID